MARRPQGNQTWLREALIDRRTRLVERFDSPHSRERLGRYIERVRSGAPLVIGVEELFLVVHAVDSSLAEQFTAKARPARWWLLDEANELRPCPGR